MYKTGTWGKVSGRRGGRNGWEHPERKGTQPARSPGQLPTTHRITPIEPLYYPCVLGKCETGTEVLRKDKRGGRGRWPGFSACHKGQLSEGEKKLGCRAHAALCLCLRGDSRCGERSTWGHQVSHLSGEGGGSTREKEPLISCLRSSSPAYC